MLFRIFVPSTKNGNEQVSGSEFEARVERVATWLSRFGGFTRLDGSGGWLSDTKGLVTEKVTVVESFGPHEKLEDVKTFCQELAKDWSQEAIGLQIVQLNMLFVEA